MSFHKIASKPTLPGTFNAIAALDQADPVSTTLYTVLDTTANVRIIQAAARVDWTVQPDPLDMVITVDGVTLTFSMANPVTVTWYCPALCPYGQQMTTWANALNGQFLLEGRSVKIQARTTGGTTSALYARVIYQTW